MPKILVSTNLEPELVNRLKAIAEVDDRSDSQIIAWCVKRALPELETEILHKKPPPDKGGGGKGKK